MVKLLGKILWGGSMICGSYFDLSPVMAGQVYARRLAHVQLGIPGLPMELIDDDLTPGLTLLILKQQPVLHCCVASLN